MERRTLFRVIVECQKCGAPLSVVEGQRLVLCTYCGATSLVPSMRAAAPPLQPPQPLQYPSPMPAPEPRVAPRPRAARGAVGLGLGAGGLVLGAVGLVFGIGVVSLVVFTGRGAFVTRVNPNAPATVETIPLAAATPVMRTIPAVAGGPIPGSTLDSHCRGYLPASPQFSLRLTSPLRVRLTTLGSNDLTMALREPSGVVRCDDDGGDGSNPLLDMTLAPGVYPVWIGTYRQNANVDFRLDLQSGVTGAQLFNSALAVTAAPTLGDLALAGPSSVATRSGTAGGLIDATSLGNTCRGHIPAAPHLTLTTTGYRRVVLFTSATSDLTMVVRDSAGVIHCDDDSGGGTQPRITATLPPGLQQVWIGTYSASDSAPFQLSVQSDPAVASAADGLAPESSPTVATLDLDAVSPTSSYRGVIAGSVAASGLGPSCTGFLTSSPQLRLVTRSPRHVTISATSSTDLTMLARGPSGDMVCVDDSDGSANPSLSADIAAGTTTLWIGSFARTRASFRVQVAVRPVARALPVK